MRQSAIRLLILATCAVALLAVTPASARTSSHKHINKHHKVYRSHTYRSNGFGYRLPADQGWSAPRPSYPSGGVCAGAGRSFDCKVWPPPMDEDPDRKASSSDGA
jgi:hypothetical protein